MTNSAPSTTFDAYRQQLNGMPTSKFIGAICWFTVNESNVVRDEVEKLFLDRNLDERFIPNPVKPVDAFRRATSRHDLTYPVGDRQDATLYFEEVDFDEERVIQHLFRKVRDRQKVELTHSQVGEAIFYRQSRKAKRNGVGGESVAFSLKRSQLNDTEYDQANKLIETVHNSYERNKGYLTSQALRGMVRDYVVSLNAISVRPSGGVYFVHRSRTDTVNLLAEVVTQLGEGSMLHMLPLVDNEQQRGMLTEAFQDEVDDECNRLLKLVGDINDEHKGTVPARKYAQLRAALDDTMERAEEYTKVLGLAQNRAANSIDMAMTSLLAMASRIEH
jgi:hypothetical protein